MSMLRMPDGLTKNQKRIVGKARKGAKRGQKKTSKTPGPRGKMPKGVSKRKKRKRKR